MRTVELTPEVLNSIPVEDLQELLCDLQGQVEQDLVRHGRGGGAARFEEGHLAWMAGAARAVGTMVSLLGSGVETTFPIVWSNMRLGYAIAHLELEREKHAVEELTK